MLAQGELELLLSEVNYFAVSFFNRSMCWEASALVMFAGNLSLIHI